MKSPIYIFDLQPYLQKPMNDIKSAKQCWDISHLVLALQGLVNRDEPRLYLKAIQPADDFWWNWMHEDGNWLNGTETVELKTLDDLLYQFSDFYNGVVIYDPFVPATSNIASTISGVENLLPIRYDINSDSLYSELVMSRKIDDVIWLLNENGTSIFTAKNTGMQRQAHIFGQSIATLIPVCAIPESWHIILTLIG